LGDGFRKLDDLVLHLKGLVLVRELRERRGADEGELLMYGAEIDRVRGLQVTIVTSAQTDREGKRLLQLLGMPFKS